MQHDHRGISRRAALRRLAAGSLVVSAVSALPTTNALAGQSDGRPRSLSFKSLHTGDHAKAIYWRDGKYQPDALRSFNVVLRDWRSGDLTDMDLQLFDLLHRLRTRLGTTAPFEVVSGYRSPKTNAQLAAKSSGVAKRSLHMRGKAIDIRLPDLQLAGLRQAALDLGAGGVGYYPRSGFVHVDTGRVRSWGPAA